MTVTVPPRSTDTQDDRDLAQRVSDLEALIEEARRRARRRRRLYAAALVAAAGAVAAALFAVGGKGHSSAGGQVAEGAPVSAAAQPGSGRWGPSHGPDGGGLTLAVDPSHPSVVYAGGFGTVFKSSDAGGSWKAVTSEPWTRVGALAVDPTRSHIVYAGTDHGVAKSVDSGRHWHMVNRGLFVGQTLRRGEGVGSLVIVADEPQTVYAERDGALFRTSDGGEHWRLLAPPAYRKLRCPHCAVLAYGYVAVVAIDPKHAQTIFAAYERGPKASLYKSSDGGDSWHQVALDGSFPSAYFSGLAIGDDSPGTLYATGMRPGVYASSDGGATWSLAGLPTENVWDLRVDSGRVYASTGKGRVFETSDGGVTWQAVGSGLNLPNNVVADSRDPNTLYGIGDRVVKSIDGGHTWAAADNGLVSTLIFSLALAPGGARVLYAGTYGGVFKSVDTGRTWRFERSGLGGDAWVGELAVDPQNPRTIYAAEQRRGLFKSNDAGVHWSRVQTAFPSNGVQALAIDPQHPRTVYVADCGGACSAGTFQKTDDGGASWRPITGIPWAVQSLAIDPQHPNTVFAGTRRGDIFRSSDGARSWHRVATPPDLPKSHQYAIVAIAIDPRDADNVYAGRNTGGIIKSSDGGKTWTRANAGLTGRNVNTLAVDPRNPRILYVSTGASIGPARVFRSTDGAGTWHELSAGLPAVGVTAFAIDSSGRSVFAGTAGAGVVQLQRGR